MIDPYSLSSYEFTLPPELIAQHPAEPRDQSRLMVVNRLDGTLTEIRFGELVDFLNPGDSLIMNDTKVIPARLIGTRDGGGSTEVFLVKRLSLDTWEALARPGKRLRLGSRVVFGEGLACVVTGTLDSGNKVLQFQWKGTFRDRPRPVWTDPSASLHPARKGPPFRHAVVSDRLRDPSWRCGGSYGRVAFHR